MNRLEMSIGIIVACIPTIRPIIPGSLCKCFQRDSKESHSKHYISRLHGVMDTDEQRRLRGISPHLEMNFPPNTGGCFTTRAYSDIGHSSESSAPRQVFSQEGISKTTEFRVSTTECNSEDCDCRERAGA